MDFASAFNVILHNPNAVISRPIKDGDGERILKVSKIHNCQLHAEFADGEEGILRARLIPSDHWWPVYYDIFHDIWDAEGDYPLEPNTFPWAFHLAKTTKAKMCINGLVISIKYYDGKNCTPPGYPYTGQILSVLNDEGKSLFYNLSGNIFRPDWTIKE